MASAMHFISGLPRSGSTLLSAILRQNPRFAAGITSPVASLCLSLIPKMSAGGEFGSMITDAQRRAVLRAVFHGYHADATPGGVVFDTNRIWSGKLALLADLYPGARIVCCVREVGWIIDSLERLLRKHPLQAHRVFSAKAAVSLYSRVEALMNSDNGLVGLAWSSLREAWFSERASQLVLVTYEGLVANPDAAIRRLYAAIGEPFFQHDFENVSYEEPGFDADFGLPGLHTVCGRVARPDRRPCIPPDIFEKYADSDFWRRHPRAHPFAPTIVC